MRKRHDWLDWCELVLIASMAAVLFLSLMLTGCAVPMPRECEHGYSWRGDCNQQMFKE